MSAAPILSSSPLANRHCHRRRSHRVTGTPTLFIKNSTNNKPPNTKPASWVSPDWLTSITKSLTSVGLKDESNIPNASAKLDDVTDLLGGALFLPLFKWMNDYGPIYRLPAGPRNFVVVSDPHIAKHVLRNYGTKYAKGLVAEVSEFLFGSGFAIAEGSLWTVRRRAVVPSLHKKYLSIVVDRVFCRCAEQLVAKLKPAVLNGSAVNMEEAFSQLTLDVIGLALFNYNFDSLTTNSPVIDAVYTALKEAELRSTDILPYWKINFLCKVIPRQIKAEKAVSLIRQTVEELISKCKEIVETEGERISEEEYVNYTDPSILRFLLASREEVSSTQLRDDLLSMLVAGHETTGSVLTWTSYLLSKDSSSLQKVRDEVDRVLQGRLPTYEDIKNLKFLTRCIMESMRLYPRPPVLLRRAQVAYILPGNYKVNPGQDIMISVYNIHDSAQIRPLVKPTKDIMDIHRVEYAWHEFFPDGLMANPPPSVWNLPSRSPIDDPSSPFFLHHSDNPGVILVSQPLTGDNFASWSRSMKIALSVKNKLGFIDGSILKPEESESHLASAWNRNNNMVISWLLNSVSKDISASILFTNSAFDIWSDLRDRFQQSNGPRIFQIRRDLITLRQDEDPVSVYFTKLKALWDELNNFRPICDCGKCCCNGVKSMDAFVQMDYTMAFLMGLNDSFAQVRSQVLLIDPLPPINRVFALVVQEERQRSISNQSNTSTSNNNMAFAVKSEQYLLSNNSRILPKFQRGRPFCTACNIPGHTVETCYKIHGYPPGFKHKTKISYRNSHAATNQVSQQVVSDEHKGHSSNANKFQHIDKSQMEQLMAMIVQHFSASDKKDTSQEVIHDHQMTGTCLSISVPSVLNSSSCWIVDSGASRHICCDAKAFISHRAVENSRVVLPNHEQIDVKFCGDIRLGPSLLLMDVLYIPEFKFNLLSVSYLLAHTQTVINFHRDSFIIQEITTLRMIGKGKKIEGLYVLDNHSSFPAFPEPLVNQVGTMVWHNRLGHPSVKVLQTLNSYLDLDVKKLPTKQPCSICPLAKQKRLSFDSHHNVSSAAFDLVHCDVWGPYHVSTYNNQRYFLTLVDDCTRFTWVFLLQHKSEAESIVSRFCTMIETQFNKKIKSFRTDNAKELSFTQFFLSEGILHQFSCVQTPQQNSVVKGNINIY